MAEELTNKQLIDRMYEAEAIADEAVRLIQQYQEKCGEGYAHPVVRKHYQYLREYYAPRHVVEPQGAAR